MDGYILFQVFSKIIKSHNLSLNLPSQNLKETHLCFDICLGCHPTIPHRENSRFAFRGELDHIQKGPEPECPHTRHLQEARPIRDSHSEWTQEPTQLTPTTLWHYMYIMEFLNIRHHAMHVHHGDHMGLEAVPLRSPLEPLIDRQLPVQ